MEDVREATKRVLALPLRRSITHGRWNGHGFRAIADHQSRNIAWVDTQAPEGTMDAIIQAVNSFDRYEIALQVIANAPPGTEGSEYRAVARAALKGETGL